MIAVLTPMKAELHRVKRLFSGLEGARELNRRPEKKSGEFAVAQSLWHGTVPVSSLLPGSSGDTAEESREVELFLGVCGVGKTVSALAVQEICTCLSPELLLFGGMGGGLAPGLELGSVIIADEVQQWDMDATAVGLEPGEVPFLPTPPGVKRRGVEKRGVLRLEPGLCSRAASVAGVLGSSCVGKIVTGDSFLGRNERERKERIREKTGAILVDMEGWSVAYAAAVRGTPLLLVRIVSDTLEGEKWRNLRRGTDEASNLLARFFFEMVGLQIQNRK